MSPADLSVTGQANGLSKLKRDVFGTMVQNVTQCADDQCPNHGFFGTDNRLSNQGHRFFSAEKAASWRGTCLGSCVLRPPSDQNTGPSMGFVASVKSSSGVCGAIFNKLIRSTGGIGAASPGYGQRSRRAAGSKGKFQC